jgi:hypothetical protein
MSYINFLNRH